MVNLAVEVLAIGHDNESVVAWNFPHNLLGEENHREALPRALSMPEDTQPALVLLSVD